MSKYTPEELKQLKKDVIDLHTPDHKKLLVKATKDGIEAWEKEMFFGPMSEDTPRTDAEHDKTLIPFYEYEGAEAGAWEWARKLEVELVAWRERCLLAEDYMAGYDKGRKAGEDHGGDNLSA
jgi:hypothetical protein